MKSLLMLALLFQGADGGVITGRLLTVDGKPAVAVRVAAMPVGLPGVTGEGALLAITETDKDGQYRLERVPAGRYYITAGLVSSPSYYPGTGVASTAKEVQVVAGSVLEKMDFSMAVPDGFTVSGRLAIKPTITPTNKIGFIQYQTGVIHEETLRSDGSFEFTKVPPGQYTLQMPVGIPRAVPLLISDRDITGLVVGNSSGVHVIGKLKMNGIGSNPVPPTNIALIGSENAIVVGGVPGAVSGMPYVSARSNNDGSFEFLGVLPGTYTLRTSSPGNAASTTTVTVADKDITGLELPIPYSLDVAGRAVMADGSNLLARVPGIVVVEATRYSNTSIAAVVAGDGSFRMPLTQGDFQIGLRNLPLGLKIESITAKGFDVLKNGLHIEPGQTIDEIVMTVGTVPLDSVRGVRFSGKVTGLPAGKFAGGKVLLNAGDSKVSNLETSIQPDGTFEFAKVPSGYYLPRIGGLRVVVVESAPRLEQVYVGTDDVSGFQIPVVPTVDGKIIVVDESGRIRSDVIPSAQISFQGGNRGFGTGLRPDGTFNIGLEIGDLTIRIDRLPAQFTIQSITSGSVDLLKNPLKVEFNSPPAEIQVRVLYKP